ncbi:MAG: hypothetical protein GX224_06110 [Thermoplasmatales archaeon]|nr:hypothetical protein [Thermoplasmatales archaeon]
MVVERADASIERDKSYMYDELVGYPSSVFYGRTKTDVFVAAASIGYYFKEFEPIKNKQNLFVSTTLGSKMAESMWILKSIAISHEGIGVLESTREVLNIAQDYANSGITRLYNIWKDGDDMTRDLVRLMIESVKDFDENPV